MADAKAECEELRSRLKLVKNSKAVAVGGSGVGVD